MILLSVAAIPHATPHVIVDQVSKALTVQDSGWVIFAACAAAGAAIATFVLALITRNLAKATSEMSSATREMVAKTAALGAQTAKQTEESALAIEQAQRHHEQSLMPIVWVSLNCFRVQTSEGWAIGVEGTLISSGLGPATAVYLHLNLAAYHPPHAIYLGLIGPKQERPFKTMYPLGTMHQGLLWFPYDCVTRYRTIFDTEGAIAQHSHSGKAEHALVVKYIAPSAASDQKFRITSPRITFQRKLWHSREKRLKRKHGL